jgi:PAS domain-containing protein
VNVVTPARAHNEGIASSRAEPAMLRSTSIRAYLLRLTLAIALPLIALEAWNLYSTAKADSERARQQVFHLAQVTASETARFLGQTKDVLDGLAARPAVSALDPARCDPFLKDFAGLVPHFANVVTIDMDARAVCSAVPLTRPTRGDPDRFIKLMRGPDELTVGKAAPGVVTGRWVVPIGRPLLDAQGGIAGVVILALDLKNLPVLPSIEGLGAKTVTGILAADGTVLAHSAEPDRFVGTNQLHREATRKLLLDQRGTQVDLGVEGVLRIRGYTPIPGTDWIAIASIPASEVYAVVNTRIAASAVISLAILFAVLLLALRLSRRIGDPITAFARTADEVAAGNLAARAPVTGAAEIAQVAVQFNDMLDVRARAEAELRKSEERYRTLFEGMDEGFCVIEMIYDPDGKPADYRFLEINPAFMKQTGLTDALTKTMREMVPDHDAHWFEIYGKVARTGVAIRFENPAVAMQRYYDVFAFRVGGDGSQRVGILLMTSPSASARRKLKPGWRRSSRAPRSPSLPVRSTARS